MRAFLFDAAPDAALDADFLLMQRPSPHWMQTADVLY
jgi:hypothetical protein